METCGSEEILKCPQCGANMELEESDGRQSANCPYCGYSRIMERELTPEEKEAHMRRLSYEREKGRLKAQAEYEKAERRRAARPKRIVLAILAIPFVIGIVLGVITAVFGDPTLPKADPFEQASITFSGADGSGSAKVSGLSGVIYTVENNGELEEGGTVTVTAKSESYFLTRKTAQFKAEGLDLYLTDVSMLDEQIVSVLRERTAAAVDSEFSATGDFLSAATKHYDSYEWEPIGVYVVSDGEHEDHLIDAVRLTFTRGDESVTAIAAYKFDDVLLHSEGISRVSWSREGFIGPTMDIGRMGVGSNPVWGSYMGAMNGFGSEDELMSYIKNSCADLTTLQKYE